MHGVAFILLLGPVMAALSQAVLDDGKPPQKQRSAELEALNHATGKWTSEFIVRVTPESKGVKSKGISVVQWSANSQFLLSDDWTLIDFPKSWVNHLSITTWDPIKKEYRITDINALATTTCVMTISGRKNIIYSESKSENHVTKTTIIFDYISDTEIKITSECLRDDGQRWVFVEGTAKKVSD